MNLNYYSLLLLFSVLSFSQTKLDDVLKKYNSNSVDYISVEELIHLQNTHQNIKLLDTREASEFSISHLQNAIYTGHEEFNLNQIQHKIKKQDTIVVYCSIGVRSEQIGEKLQEAGFKNVFNLYGGIFDWVNQGYPVYNQQGKPTQKIHAYDRFWSRYLEKGQKVY